MSTDAAWESAPERFRLAPAYQAVASVIGWTAAIELGHRVWTERKPPSRPGKNGDQRGIVYVPKTIKGRVGKWLAGAIGLENAMRLSAAFPGESFEFSSIESAMLPRRNEAIAKQAIEGRSLRVLAILFGMTDRTVRRVLRDAGVCPIRHRTACVEYRVRRDSEVRSAVRAGRRVEDVAAEWGITPQFAERISNRVN